MKHREHSSMWRRFIRPKPVGCGAILLRVLAWMFFLMGLIPLLVSLAVGQASGGLFYAVLGLWLGVLICYYGDWSDILSDLLSDILSNLWWYRLSRQKWTNFEMELSSMRKEMVNDQTDRQNTVFCSLTTDDIAHNCKIENSLSDHFSPLKPFDSL
jgi:hypothetical protein